MPDELRRAVERFLPSLATLRRAALIAFLTVAAHGCSRCSDPEPFESFVDVPTTLDAAKALEDPPDVTVTVDKQRVPAGGGGCGHSPVCIILLPVLVVSAIFPDKIVIASVREKNVETYVGVFKDNGQFLRALVRKGAEYRKATLVELPALGRNVAVYVERAPIGADGNAGTFERVSIQKQVDLVTGYRALFSNESDPTRRSNAVSEALSWLGDDALPMARERLLDAKESTALKESAVKSMCQGPWFGGTAARRNLLDDLAATNPSDQTPVLALGCFHKGEEPDIPAARRSTSLIVKRACQDRELPFELLRGLTSWASPEEPGGQPPVRVLNPKSSAALRATLASEVDSCANPARKTLLSFVLGFETKPGEVPLAIAKAERSVSTYLIGALDPNTREDNAVLAEALEHPDAPTAAIAKRLDDAGAPTERELTALLKAYLRKSSAKDAVRGRAEVLNRLGRAVTDHKKHAREVIGRALPGAGDDEPVLRAALAALGDHDQELPASRGLAGWSACAAATPVTTPSASASPSGSASAPASASVSASAPASAVPSAPAEPTCVSRVPRYVAAVSNASELVAHALVLANCTDADIRAAAEAAPNVKPGARGRVCKGAP